MYIHTYISTYVLYSARLMSLLDRKIPCFLLHIIYINKLAVYRMQKN